MKLVVRDQVPVDHLDLGVVVWRGEARGEKERERETGGV